MRTVIRAVALAALLTCATPATAGAAREPAAHAVSRVKSPVSLVLGTVGPKTAGPSGAKSKITITGTVQNRAGRDLPGVSVRLRTSATRMTSRTQLAQYAAGQPSWLRGIGDQRRLPAVDAAGGSAPFSLSTNTATVGFGEFGVYPIGVEVVNQYGQVLSGINTFITFVPERRDFKRLSVGWIWPLIDRQHRTTDDTFTSDRLTTDMSPGGRLHGLVQAAASTGTPITWSIDPALLDDVQTMANGSYTVRAPRAKESTRKPKSTVAAQWLNALKTASKGDPYFVVPYADPDAVALVRHNMSGHLADAYANTGVAGQVLGRQPTVHAAWPPSGMAGQGTLNQLAAHGRLGGNGAFVMSSAAFADPPQGYTPSATTQVPTRDGPRRAIVYDETLNKIVSADTRAPGAAVLAEQRFLAETAMIAAEAPEVSRSLVIVPDRRWNPSPAFAKNLLTYTSGAVWMQRTRLEQIVNAPPQERDYRGYPDELEAAELDATYLERVDDIAGSAARFTRIMVSPVTMNYTRAVLRMESSYWRGSARHKRRAVATRQALADRIARDMGRVRIITSQNSRVSLAGSSGRIPITIVNDLPDQTIRVRLVVVPENTTRLQVGRVEDEVIELGPEQKVTRPIPIRSAGNGNVQVHLRLRTADNRAFGPTTTITVRTTGYGRLALLITGGGLAVLFVGVGVRAMRARRRRNSEAAGDGSTGTGPAAAGTPEPGAPFAGDPAGLGPAPGDGQADGGGDGRAGGAGAGFHAAAFPPPTARGAARPAVVPGTGADQSTPVHPTTGPTSATAAPWAAPGSGLEQPGVGQPDPEPGPRPGRASDTGLPSGPDTTPGTQPGDPD